LNLNFPRFFSFTHKKKSAQSLSVKELSKAMELSPKEIQDDKEMLEGIIRFHDKTVSQIMTSRLDLFALDIQSGFKEIIEHVIHSGYSRIPVYSETYDTIKGILYVKDLLPYVTKSEEFCWQKLLRPAFFVPETKKIDDLLKEFRTGKIHLAIVVNEFGGTSGIVTIEDILEEIVGEISDEYDSDDFKFTQLTDGSYVFEAKIPLTDFFKITNINPQIFGRLTEDVETLAGLVLEIGGNLPERREVVKFGNYAFQVLEVKQRRISKVRFTVKQENSPG
jgi:gliding motility-associated protein GldE